MIGLMKDCIFCKIVKGKLPADKVYEDEGVLVFKNIKPAASVHLLVVPKKHRGTFLDLTARDISSMLAVAQKIIKDKKLTQGYKLVFNGGSFQFVPHAHLHLLAGKFDEDFERKL